MTKINNKCKKCKQCEITNVSRTDRNGRKVEYRICKEQKSVHDLCHWTYRSNAQYIGSAIKIDGKYEYLTSFFKDDSNNEIDHIDGNVHHNELKNLAEVSKVQNCQNRHDRKGCAFHNVKKNPNNTYTAFKIVDGQYRKIATCNTDIEAYDKFVKYCRNHLIPVYNNTWSWQTYSAVKNQIPYLGGIYNAKM